MSIFEFFPDAGHNMLNKFLLSFLGKEDFIRGYLKQIEADDRKTSIDEQKYITGLLAIQPFDPSTLLGAGLAQSALSLSKGQVRPI